MSTTKFGRRKLLAGALGTGALGTVAGLAPVSRIFAASPVERRTALLYFNGGWDVIIGPDARNRDYMGTLDLGASLLPAQYRDPITATIGGTEVLWGAAMAPLLGHTDVLTLFRGVNMNTVSHPTGRAYVNTFIPPAGVVARGDSLGTRLASGVPADDFIMPNVAIGVPSFNLSYGSAVTGVGVAQSTQVRDLLRPLGAELPDDVLTLLRRAQDATGSCVHERVTGGSPEGGIRASRDRVRRLFEQGLEAEFDLSSQADVRARYGIQNANNGREPAVVAAITHKLLKTGLASTVTAQLQSGMDTHATNWATDQAQRLEQGNLALAALLNDLREDDPNLECTTVVAYSEFARTPRINGNSGRDHWFASSILVFGGGLRRGVVGATVEETLGLRGVDFETGLPADDGIVMLPEHVGATLAAAAGLDHSPFRVEPLRAWIGA
ncbi:MAG: DUF1501 domain-containing protein [Myxococcota bacterium]